MANVLSVYDPLFYAQEGIRELEKALGMASRVYRGHDKAPQQKGSTISIPVPGTFVAQDAPSPAQDVNASEVQMVLNQWKEVKFGLTDKELSFTQDKIIQDHIRPAVYALADVIDQSLTGLYADVPWYQDIAATAGVPDITATRKLMFDNKVPLNDPAMLHWMLDSDMEADFLSNPAFTQWQGSGQAGVEAQLRGTLGRRFNFEFFANQNVKSHTKGTASTPTLAVNNVAGYPKGSTVVNLDAGAVTGTLVKGDSLVFAGHSQRYVVTATATAAGNALNGVQIFPALKAPVADGEVVTVSLDDHSASIAFHRDAFALAMAPLSTLGNELGARIETVTDPITNLSLRSRLYYEGANSKVFVAIDALWGVRTLDPNKAVRARN